jgi:Flp pilus assembly protein TadD
MPGTAPGTPAARDPHEALSTLPSRFEDVVILAAFYDGIGADALRVEALERALEFSWRPQILLEQLGPMQLGLEDYAGAERTYRKLLAQDPRNAPALNELAFLVYQRGDLDEALSFMRKALVLDEDNPQYLQNLDRLRAAFDPAAAEGPAH